MSKFDKEKQRLIRRYLIWCYKTTKEEFERIERKFTQLTVDEYVLVYLTRKYSKINHRLCGDQARLNGFKQYIEKKRSDAFAKKFSSQTQTKLVSKYSYLKNRLEAVEKAIEHFLGKADLNNIQTLYENEMTNRILQARDQV